MGNNKQALEPRLLVRMFFKNRLIETRPLAWVRFVVPDEMIEETGPALAKTVEKAVNQQGEVYLCFVNELTGLQIYRDTYVDARRRNKSDTTDHSQGRHGNSSSASS